MKGFRVFWAFLTVFLVFSGTVKEVAAKPNASGLVPGDPVLDSPSSISQSGFTFSWTLVGGATDYWLDISTDNFSTFEGAFQDLAIGNISSFNVTGLSPGITYQCRLRATDGVDVSGYSNVLSVVTIPATPSGLLISNVTTSGFQLNWSPVSGFDNFFVDLSVDSFSNYLENNLSVAGPTSYVFSGLSAETEYQVRIRSSNSSGTSPSSIELSITTMAPEPTAPPSALGFSNITTTSFDISYTTSPGASQYLILRKAGSDPTEIPVDGNSYTVGTSLVSSLVVYVGSGNGFSESGLNAGTEYHYSIFSFNGSGSAINYYTGASLTGSQATICTAPTVNAPSLVSQSGATISWNSVTGASNYSLDVSTNGFSTFVSGYQNLLTGNVTSLAVTSLSPGTSYDVRVRAVNATGQSANSNTITVLTVSANPTGLIISGITPTGFTLTWDAVNGATQYMADISLDGFNSFTQENVLVNGTSHAFSNLTPETFYEVRLSSVNVSGESGNSISVPLITLAADATAAPTALVFSNITASSFDVSFTASSGATKYLVLRKSGGDPSEVPVDGTSYSVGNTLGSSTIVFFGNGISFSEPGLSAGTDYHYSIFAFNGTGSTANYFTGAALTGSQSTICAAPVVNPPTLISQTSATVSWSSITGASNYSIDISADGFSSFLGGYQNHFAGNVTSISITGLNAGTTYQIRLRAVNSAGQSVNSNTETILTIPANPTGLTISTITSNGFTLAWNSSVGATQYMADISTDGFSSFIQENVSENGTIHAFSGLSPETVFQVRLSAVNSSGESNNSGTVSFSTMATEPLSAPSVMNFTGVTSSSFNVSFTAAQGSPKYLVLRKSGSTPTEQPADATSYSAGTTLGASDIVFVGSGTSFSQSALNGGDTYYYLIYSFNGSGVTANYLTNQSLSGSQLTLPNAPTLNAPILITQSSAAISWSAVASATNYAIDVSSDGFSTFVSGYQNFIAGNVNSVAITGLNSGVSFSVRIRAINNTGQSVNSNAQTVLTIPADPTGLIISAITPAGLTLTWSPTTGSTHYLADISSDGFNSFAQENVLVNSTSGTFTGLNSETSYQIRLSAVNSTGESNNSTSASFTTLAVEPVGAATALTFNNVTSTSFDVSFAAASGSPKYLVLRRSGSAPTETPVDAVGYTAGNMLGSSNIVFVGNGTSFTETSLNPGTSYSYKIYPFYGAGITANYNIAASTGGNQITKPIAPVVNGPTAITQTSANISWSASPSATAYFLDVSSDNFSTFVTGLNNFALGNIGSYGITGLTAGTQYQVRLRAANAGGASVSSNTVGILTIPATPIGLTVSGITSSSFVLTWNAISNATGFVADLSLDGFSTLAQQNVALAGSSTHTFTGLTSAATYSVRLRSVNASGTSGNSTVVSANILFVEPSVQPTSLAFSSITATGFGVSFTGTGTPTYLILRKQGSSPTEVPVDGNAYSVGSLLGTSTVAYIGNATGVNESTLNPGTQYFYSIFAFAGSGSQTNYRTLSPLQGSQFTKTLAPVLNSPSGLTQTSGLVSWVAIPTASDYAIDVSTDGFITYLPGFQNQLAGNVTSMLITGLVPATQYQIRLRAINAGGQSQSSNMVTLLTIPSTPTGLVASSPNSSGVVLNWNTVPGATNIVADVSSNNFLTYVLQNEILSGSASHTFNNLPSATTMEVRLRSVNASGQSPSSGTVQFTTLSAEPAAAPTTLTFTSTTTTGFNASFTGASGSPTYLVVRREGTPIADMPMDGTSYVVGSSIGTGTVVHIGSTTNFNQLNLTPGAIYHYAVIAFQGTGVTTNYLTSTVLIGSWATLCTEPTLNVATSISQTSLQVSWGVVFGASNYALDVKTLDGNFVSGYQGKLTGNTTSHLITGLTPGTNYQIQLRAVNGSGESATSNQTTELTVPATPTGLIASNITAAGFTLSWSAIGGAEDFRIDISPDDFTNFTYNNVPIPGPTSFSISGLASATTFKVRLRSVNGSGTSPNSSVLTVATVNLINPLAMGNPAYSNQVGVTPAVVTVEVTGGTNPKTVSLHYRGVASKEFASVEIPLKAGTSSVYEVSVTSAMADELGAEFYITAADAATVEVETPNHYFIYRAFEAAEPLSITWNTSSFNGSANTYQLFSVPYILSDNSIAKLFDATLGVPGKNNWRVFHYNGESYDEYPNAFSQLELGKGYWFNSLKKNFTIDVGEAKAYEATQSSSFEINFRPGWNQVGDPYPFNLDWDAIKNANPAVGLNSLFGFESGSFQRKSTLGAWKGGFVFADNGGVVSFPITAKTTNGGRQQSNMTVDIDGNEWQLPLLVQANGWSSESGIGMNPKAQQEKDQWDEIVMPRFINFVELRTHHPKFFVPYFSTDVVPTAEEYTWQFELNANVDTDRIELFWNAELISQAKASLLLLDESNDVLLDMKANSHYRLTLHANHRIKIIYSQTTDFTGGLTELNRAFPNPYQDVFTVPIYTVAPDANVQVIVYSELGQVLSSYQKNVADSGYAEILIDGSSFTQGMLFYRVSTNGVFGKLNRLIRQ